MALYNGGAWAEAAREELGQLGERQREWQSLTLPTGFGELEVLAVGTVLLVEGEPGRIWGGAELSRPPECRSQLQSWQGDVPKPYSSVLKPIGSSDGCT